jgi:threonine aldolase
MMIDLRSDTLTTPDEGMRHAIANAPVGDDVYSEDPTVERLQQRVAEMFGKEAALFVPSGTQGNQICLALHASTGDEIICEKDAHIFHYENAATSVIARAQLHGIPSEYGAMPLELIEQAIRPTAYYYPKTAAIAVENTHNRHGGTVVPLEHLKSIRSIAQHNGLALHCDGARIWNAITASGVSAKEYGEIFDTLSVCMSKGLGAPIGSLIVGSRQHIERARRWRKMLGGGMRQVGVLAAAAMYALDVTLAKLARDHEHARMLAESLAKHPKVLIDMNRVQTNIVVFTVEGVNDAQFVADCAERGLRIAPIYPGTMRAVMYHQVTSEMVYRAAAILHDVLGD